jgi:ribosomal RNA-processing protein 36
LKKLELVQKYKEIQDKGGSVEKYLEKRRKKNATKEHKRIPIPRRREKE